MMENLARFIEAGISDLVIWEYGCSMLSEDEIQILVTCRLGNFLK